MRLWGHVVGVSRSVEVACRLALDLPVARLGWLSNEVSLWAAWCCHVGDCSRYQATVVLTASGCGVTLTPKACSYLEWSMIHGVVNW